VFFCFFGCDHAITFPNCEAFLFTFGIAKRLSTWWFAILLFRNFQINIANVIEFGMISNAENQINKVI
jgi:hypothetical protein